MSSAKQRKPFKPPRPSTSTAATRTPTQPSSSRRVSRLEATFSSSPEPEPQTQPAAPNPLLDDDDAPPLLPPKLLKGLLQHHFEKPNTKLGSEAGELVGRYMEIFVREALARAVAEKEEAVDGDGGVGQGKGRRGVVGRDFLEVEDLERLTPQLVLDF